MGQNMVGVPLLRFHGLRRGQRVRMRYAEVLYPDLPEYAGLKGTLMLENIRAAMAQDIYIARGEDCETYTLVIPPGHTATLRVVGMKTKELKAGRHTFRMKLK